MCATAPRPGPSRTNVTSSPRAASGTSRRGQHGLPVRPLRRFLSSDYAFPENAIVTEAPAGLETALVADLDLGHLDDLHRRGSVRNLRQRRTDLYRVERVPAANNTRGGGNACGFPPPRQDLPMQDASPDRPTRMKLLPVGIALIAIPLIPALILVILVRAQEPWHSRPIRSPVGQGRLRAADPSLSARRPLRLSPITHYPI